MEYVFIVIYLLAGFVVTNIIDYAVRSGRISSFYAFSSTSDVLTSIVLYPIAIVCIVGSETGRALNNATNKLDIDKVMFISYWLKKRNN